MTNMEGFSVSYNIGGVDFRDITHHILFLPEKRSGLDITPIASNDEIFCGYMNFPVKILSGASVREMEDFISGKRKPEDPAEAGGIPFCKGFDYNSYEDPIYEGVVKAISSVRWARFAIIGKKRAWNWAASRLERECQQAGLIKPGA